MDNNLGKKIKELRDGKGLNQTEFGMAMSVNINTIGAYERGERLPELDFLIRMAVKLDVDLIELVDLRVRLSPDFSEDSAGKCQKFLSHLSRQDYFYELAYKLNNKQTSEQHINTTSVDANKTESQVKEDIDPVLNNEIDKNLLLNCLEACQQFYGPNFLKTALDKQFEVVSQVYNLLCRLTSMLGDNLSGLGKLEVGGVLKQMEVFGALGKLPKIGLV